MLAPGHLDVTQARHRLSEARLAAWDVELRATISRTLELLGKLEDLKGFHSICENLALCASQFTLSLAKIALAVGVKNLYGEPSVFMLYQEKLKAADNFLIEQSKMNAAAAHSLVALVMPMMDHRVNVLLEDLRCSHDSSLKRLDHGLADGEAPFDLCEDGVKACGGFAEVRIGWWRPISLKAAQPAELTRVAVKHIRARDIDLKATNETGVQERLRKRINREMRSWKAVMGHRHILPFIGFSYSPEPFLVSPWCENGDLRAYLEANPTVNRIQLLVQAADGFHFLHSQKPPMIHQDIKPDNILINSSREAVISDFGLAKIKSEVPTGMTTEGTTKGTLLYMAPELHLDTSVEGTAETDVYAFALLILEILSRKRPYWNMKMHLLVALMRGIQPKPEDHPALTCGATWSLLERGWHLDPMQRPSMAIVLRELKEKVGKPNPSGPAMEAAAHPQVSSFSRQVTQALSMELRDGTGRTSEPLQNQRMAGMRGQGPDLPVENGQTAVDKPSPCQLSVELGSIMVRESDKSLPDTSLRTGSHSHASISHNASIITGPSQIVSTSLLLSGSQERTSPFTRASSVSPSMSEVDRISYVAGSDRDHSQDGMPGVDLPLTVPRPYDSPSVMTTASINGPIEPLDFEEFTSINGPAATQIGTVSEKIVPTNNTSVPSTDIISRDKASASKGSRSRHLRARRSIDWVLKTAPASAHRPLSPPQDKKSFIPTAPNDAGHALDHYLDVDEGDGRFLAARCSNDGMDLTNDLPDAESFAVASVVRITGKKRRFEAEDFFSDPRNGSPVEGDGGSVPPVDDSDSARTLRLGSAKFIKLSKEGSRRKSASSPSVDRRDVALHSVESSDSSFKAFLWPGAMSDSGSTSQDYENNHFSQGDSDDGIDPQTAAYASSSVQLPQTHLPHFIRIESPNITEGEQSRSDQSSWSSREKPPILVEQPTLYLQSNIHNQSAIIGITSPPMKKRGRGRPRRARAVATSERDRRSRNESLRTPPANIQLTPVTMQDQPSLLSKLNDSIQQPIPELDRVIPYQSSMACGGGNDLPIPPTLIQLPSTLKGAQNYEAASSSSVEYMFSASNEWPSPAAPWVVRVVGAPHPTEAPSVIHIGSPAELSASSWPAPQVVRVASSPVVSARQADPTIIRFGTSSRHQTAGSRSPPSNPIVPAVIHIQDPRPPTATTHQLATPILAKATLIVIARASQSKSDLPGPIQRQSISGTSSNYEGCLEDQPISPSGCSPIAIENAAQASPKDAPDLEGPFISLSIAEDTSRSAVRLPTSLLAPHFLSETSLADLRNLEERAEWQDGSVAQPLAGRTLDGLRQGWGASKSRTLSHENTTRFENDHNREASAWLPLEVRLNEQLPKQASDTQRLQDFSGMAKSTWRAKALHSTFVTQGSLSNIGVHRPQQLVSTPRAGSLAPMRGGTRHVTHARSVSQDDSDDGGRDRDNLTPPDPFETAPEIWETITKIRCVHYGETSDIWLAEYRPDLSSLSPSKVAVRYLRKLSTQSELGFTTIEMKLPLLGLEAIQIPRIVIPWYENGDLFKAVACLETDHRHRLLLQIVDGLVYLHTNETSPVVHGDLRPGNIYIDDCGDAKIGGFESSLATVDDHQHVINSVVQDVRYRAPELIEGSPPSTASDVYSLALIGVELLSGVKPLGSLRSAYLAVAIASGLTPSKNDHPDLSGRCAELWHVFELMWDFCPSRRLSAWQVDKLVRPHGERRVEGGLV
ncbi:hypothetical protein FRB96_002047 [Tulasnella sp. 330]|nr:hypothetical protein FRB96_002047 [Tulasnella sp. 330]